MMKRKLVAQTIFISKSLLWSLLLYAAVMVLLNWDDLKKNRDKENQSWVIKNDDNRLVPVKVSVFEHLGEMLF